MRRFTFSFALGCALAQAGAAYAVTVGEAVPTLIAVSQGEDPQSLAELFLSDALREPDDGPDAANDLGSGVSAQGVLDPATDVQDWFTRRLGSLEDGPRICFRSTGSLTFSASDGGGMLGGATQTRNGSETCFAFPRLGSGAFDWTIRFSAPVESGATYAFDITTSTTEIAGEQSSGAVTVAAGERMVLKDGATLNVGGDFDCAGRLDVEGGDGRINVAGDALLACPLTIEPPGPAPAPGGKAEGDPRT
ncbi:MAG: hypothetical protein K8I02_04845, partial [Candidatus Methylomirabilis sp.]|nr:hypothetical protein [Deltaproteobacteria bacterium]